MSAFARRQHGATLIIALVFLVILTVVALSGMQSASTEIQTTLRVKNQLDLFNAAELTLKQAEAETQADYRDPVEFFGYMAARNWLSLASTSSPSDVQSLLTDFNFKMCGSCALPSGTEGRYIIEYVGPLPTSGNGGAAPGNRYLYRITAVGQQLGGGQRKLVQSYFVTSP